jgi:hypothetical protein
VQSHCERRVSHTPIKVVGGHAPHELVRDAIALVESADPARDELALASLQVVEARDGSARAGEARQETRVLRQLLDD